MRIRVLLFLLGAALGISYPARSTDRNLIYRSSWLEFGSLDSPISPEYIVIEAVDLREYVSLRHPDAQGEEREALISELEGRSSVARNLIDLLGVRFKTSVRRQGTLTPAYSADIDQRLDLAKRGQARIVALLSSPLEFEVLAMVAIFPDFGEGVPLQFVDGQMLSLPPVDIGEPSRERVRVFGSGEAFYFQENREISALASDTKLYRGDQAAMAFFAVPRDSFFVGDSRWAPSPVGKVVVNWKTFLLNLLVADGLLRFGERSVPGGSYAEERAPSENLHRQGVFQAVQRSPYIQPELIGAAPQRKVAISEIQLFTRSQFLVDHLFLPLGLEYVGSYRLGNDPLDSAQHILRISREDLEYVALEALRRTTIEKHSFFETTREGRRSGFNGAFALPSDELKSSIEDCIRRLSSEW